MKPPVHKLTKFQIIWLNNHTCKHRHTYLDHYQCYLTEHPQNLRVGYLDLETTHLRADMGIILSYCIKVDGEDRILEAVVTKDELDRGIEDQRVVKQLVEDLKQFDIIITFYGTNFDIKYMRTRALINHIPFPHYGALKHIDVYFMMKSRFLLTSSSLKNSCKQLIGKTDKTDIDYDIWRKAARGHKKSLDYILDHNRKDVCDTEKLYKVVVDYCKRTERSI